MVLVAILLIAFLCFYQFWFLRLPDRNIVKDDSLYLSPANGLVVSINHFNSDSFLVLKKKFGAVHLWTKDVDSAGYIISIQMDPTNVHYQRMPKDAKVISKNFVKGGFNNALQSNNDFGIRFENENNQILFESKNGKKFKLVQISGFVARRIEDYVEQYQELKQGDVYGLIKLGSQVTVILPDDITIATKVGETVIDGESILAKDK